MASVPNSYLRVFTGAWDAATASTKEIQAVTEAVHSAADPIRAFAPDGGAYQNEVSIHRS